MPQRLSFPKIPSGLEDLEWKGSSPADLIGCTCMPKARPMKRL
jgi:hypothetical protein